MSLVTRLDEKKMHEPSIQGFMELIKCPEGRNDAKVATPTTLDKAELLNSYMEWDQEQQAKVCSHSHILFSPMKQPRRMQLRPSCLSLLRLQPLNQTFFYLHLQQLLLLLLMQFVHRSVPLSVTS